MPITVPDEDPLQTCSVTAECGTILRSLKAVIATSRRDWRNRLDAEPPAATIPLPGYVSAETSPERTANRTSPGTS